MRTDSETLDVRPSCAVFSVGCTCFFLLNVNGGDARGWVVAWHGVLRVPQRQA
jgi:hypothetical protein